MKVLVIESGDSNAYLEHLRTDSIAYEVAAHVKAASMILFFDDAHEFTHVYWDDAVRTVEDTQALWKTQ